MGLAALSRNFLRPELRSAVVEGARESSDLQRGRARFVLAAAAPKSRENETNLSPSETNGFATRVVTH
jgi:hypothetical protein